jgi:hypothetical protein
MVGCESHLKHYKLKTNYEEFEKNRDIICLKTLIWYL